MSPEKCEAVFRRIMPKHRGTWTRIGSRPRRAPSAAIGAQAPSLAALDAAQRPQSRKEGYAIQAELEKSGKLFGWKIAATSEAGQKHINVAGPMAGRILGRDLDRRWRHGARCTATRCAWPSRNFASAWRATCRRGHAILGRGSAGRGRGAASGDRDSRFALCRFRQRRRSAADRRQCLRASVRAGRGDGADWRARDLIEEKPVITMRGQLTSVTARTCSAIPAWRWPGSPMNCASSASRSAPARW